MITGKRVLITGGGSGLGAHLAQAFAGAGAHVAICGRTQARLQEIASQLPGIEPFVADVTDEDSIAAMMGAAIMGQAAPFDIVIANAGAAETAPAASIERAEWQSMIEANLTGTFLTFREALRRMQGVGWGRLIAIASTAGLKGYAYAASYCAAKHGVIGLVRALALETVKTGITVNALCPGFIETPLLDRSIAVIMEKTGKTEKDAREALARINPMHRFVKTEEVAAAALWLCGPGSDIVTGQAIALSGGEI